MKKIVQPEDTLVLTGDHSWGRKLAESEADLDFIAQLPGRKILLRGNHDIFWNVKKTPQLNEAFDSRLFFLQNNFAAYRDIALVGTKGYTFEGPFYLDPQGRITSWDQEAQARAEKLVARELARLRISISAATAAGYKKFVMFLHYPPTNILQDRSPFTDIAEEYHALAVVYSHSHGQKRFGDSLRGNVRGVRYMLVSSDYLGFKPALIMA